MTKKISQMGIAAGLAVLMAGSMAFETPALAQATPVQPARVMVVDLSIIMRESEVAKNMQAQLKTMLETLKTDFEAKRTELQTEGEKLKTQQALYAPEVFEQKVNEFNETRQKAGEDFELRERSIRAGAAKAQRQVEEVLKPIFKEMMTERQATILMDRSTIIMGGVDEDVTADVVQRLNQRMTQVTVEPVDINELRQQLEQQRQQQQPQGQ